MCSTDYTDQDKQIQYGSLFQSRIKNSSRPSRPMSHKLVHCTNIYHEAVHVVVFSHAPSVPTRCLVRELEQNTQCTASMAQFSSTMHCSQNFSCHLLNSLVKKSCLSSLIASDRTLSPLAQSPHRLYSGLVWVIPGRPKSFLGTLLVTIFSSYTQYKQEN